MLDQENQPNLPNGTESNRSFQDKTILSKKEISDHHFTNQDECLDISLAGFNVSQLANKLERLALATPQTIKKKPENIVIEEDFDSKERPGSADSDSGKPVTSNNSSIYRSFVADSVENQELELSVTSGYENTNENCNNIELFHENLASVNLDLVSSDFDESNHFINTSQLSNHSLLENTLNKSSDSNSLSFRKNTSMDGLEAEIKLQQLNTTETNAKNSSEAGPVIAEGFTSAVGFNFEDLEALEAVRSLNDEEIRRLTIARKSLYQAFDPIVKKSNQESNSRREALENTEVMDKTILGSPQSEGSNKTLNEKIEKLECENKNLRNDVLADKEKIKSLTTSLITVTKSKDQLSTVIGEYEKTISDMVAKKEDVHKEYEARIAYIEDERAKMERHLQNSEMAFNDVHEKYNSSKQVIEAMKENETKYKTCIMEFEESLKKYEDKYMRLKMHATEQMEKATEEINEKERVFEAETSKMRIMIKRLEVKVRSLQESLERKDVENAELTNLCDELIGKLDSK
ncbi:transforming acidic coiled-coil-containing protein 1-like isoform X2 [Adelges cooleyi]|uniref:transforming acidic coiled-coil-containing protein 1-like isoform X2 n=1 Tax=Adelges cooleyi TaxID=133065 RepID=UPI00217F7A18|nr:transforming acidic coiled-coil-containing protein 1-like isoform X2 [Adelges cooleyi]